MLEELTEWIVESKVANPEATGEPPGTRSQMVVYEDAGGRFVAMVHRYLRPDDSIGASGYPDPKAVLHQGVLYVV